MSKKSKLCKRCGVNPAAINFCNECAREINQKHESVMERTVAARCYLNATKSSHKESKQLEVYAFLDIFHPEMNERKRMEIARSVD